MCQKRLLKEAREVAMQISRGRVVKALASVAQYPKQEHVRVSLRQEKMR